MRVSRAVLVLAAATALLSAGCKKPPKGPRAEVALDQTYVTKTKLLTLHYPKDFAASAAGEHSAALAPTALGSLHKESEVYFTANMTPVSNEVAEYARVILDTLARGKTDYLEVSRVKQPCFGATEGIEHVATSSDRGHTVRRWSCTFLSGGHGYSFGFFVAVPEGEEDEPLLRRIIAATEVAK